MLKIPEATKQGYAIAKEGDSINLSQPNSKTRRGRVGGGMANTLDTQQQQYTIIKGDNTNAGTQETNSVKELQILWKEIGEKAFTEWGFRILNPLQSKEVLQSDLHGSRIRETACKEEPRMDDSTLSSKEAKAERELRDLWINECKRCSSQEPRLARQFIGELAKDLSKLPQQIASTTRIRRLTPIEAARLQGFPDNWHEGVSDSQAYRCYGNAVTVAIVKLIAERLSP